MSDYIFLFDLDSTITKKEILPTIANEIGKFNQMRELTEKTMSGELPFKQSFMQRVEILSDISVTKISRLINEIPLNENIVTFIKNNRNRCFIVTGNLDVWIEKLMQKIGMDKNYYSSKAIVENDYIKNITTVIDKNAIVSQLVVPYVAIGDGNNDAEMIANAEIGIGYGGVRRIAPSILECASHVVYKEEILCQFLERLL